MFLDDKQIVKLTGRKRRSAQIRWLKQRRYRYEVNELGNPVVSCSYVESRLGGVVNTAEPEPNWQAIQKNESDAA